MDENIAAASDYSQALRDTVISRVENRSPITSGESSGTADSLDDRKRTETQRRRRRKPAGRNKRRWKPNDELNWDQKSILDDNEARRAYAKRQRLSAEGHAIAPYNTTQFLMDDHRKDSEERMPGQPTQEEVCERVVPAKIGASRLELPLEGQLPPLIPKTMSTDSLLGMALIRSEEMLNAQEYILDDFSNEYQGIHAEQLQSLTKDDLVTECMHLERKVESLERKLKSCHKRHDKEKQDLSEQISQLKDQL